MTVRLIARPVFPTRRLLTGHLQDDPGNLTGAGYLWRVLLAAQQAEQLAQDDIRAPAAMGIGALFLGSQRLAPTESGLLMESSNVLGGLIRATIEADATMSIYIQNIGEIIKHRDETKVLTINDRALVLLLRQLIRAVRQIIDETRYRGPWWFGVRASGFQDARAHSQQRLVNDLFGRTEPVGVSLTRNEYERCRGQRHHRTDRRRVPYRGPSRGPAAPVGLQTSMERSRIPGIAMAPISAVNAKVSAVEWYSQGRSGTDRPRVRALRAHIYCDDPWTATRQQPGER
jgi:hypothetical protein